MLCDTSIPVVTCTRIGNLRFLGTQSCIWIGCISNLRRHIGFVNAIFMIVAQLNTQYQIMEGDGFLERTMSQKMAQEVKQLTLDSKTLTRYKGVCQQPEGKHPWVVELKLPQNKKMWVGNIDTEEVGTSI